MRSLSHHAPAFVLNAFALALLAAFDAAALVRGVTLSLPPRAHVAALIPLFAFAAHLYKTTREEEARDCALYTRSVACAPLRNARETAFLFLVGNGILVSLSAAACVWLHEVPVSVLVALEACFAFGDGAWVLATHFDW